ncbi:MAG: hypothetical protein IJJ41_02910 [Clostridia bacterium]|nr:hypothetical protein [Clostridia bacterium]
MKNYGKKLLSVLLCVALLLASISVCTISAQATSTYASTSQNKYKIRLLVFEVETFDGSNKAFGDDSAPYVNYGSEHIGLDEEWCRVDYKKVNATGSTESAYITLYDRDGDGRYNVVSAWGSSGGYFPSKEGMIIDGFPTHLYAQYYKTGNSWKGKNGQFRIFLQVARLVDGEWVWDQGTNEETGDAVMNDSFDSDAQSTYGGGLLDLMSTRSGDNVKNVALVAEGDVPQDYWPVARGADPTVSYENSMVICPRSNEEDIVNPLLVENAPKDQYGVSMAANIELKSEVSIVGIEQNEWNTVISTHANLSGGDYNSEAYNAQTVTASIRWPQHFGVSKKATVSFLAVDYQTTVFMYDSNGKKIDECDYYYGCVPTLPQAAKPFDDAQHYLNVHWDHAAQAVSDSSNNTYTLCYDTAAHNFSEFEPVDIEFHNGVCKTDPNDVHIVKQHHEFSTQVIEATCTENGCTRHTCAQCGYYYDTEPTMKTGHSWGTGVITREPTCAQNGVRTYTCARCSATKTESVNALEHELQLQQVAPTDKHNGGVYYECVNCHAYWGAVYSERLEDYDVPDETPCESVQQALAQSDTLPAPYFNTFVDQSEQYDYATRGAALKYVHLKLPDYQPMRFTASVKVPERVSSAIGDSGNAVTDIGIIYSQTQYISSLENFTIGNENVYKMSVKEKNSAPVYDGTNWGGVTKHETADGTQLTFNLVVQVKPENWREDYCARAYITYTYNGFSYTVYDEAFSSRSVEYLARQIIANPNEPQQAKDYCQNVILKNLPS